MVLPEALTLDGITARRTKAGRLVAGVAAASDFELFKGRGQHAHKPKAKRWTGTTVVQHDDDVSEEDGVLT